MDKEKSELFVQHFANIFTTHNDARDLEIDKNLTAHIKSHQTLTCTSPKEIKEVIKSLGLKKKSTRTRSSYPKNVEGTPRKRNRTVNLHF
jgi:ABC-type thiamine transport system ATPase subunit